MQTDLRVTLTVQAKLVLWELDADGLEGNSTVQGKLVLWELSADRL